MEKKEIYRITKGQLTSGQKQISIQFGLVFETAGFVTAELYFEESVNLTEIMDAVPTGVTQGRQYLSARCQTDMGVTLELEGLDYLHINPSRCFMEMACYRRIVHQSNDLVLDGEEFLETEPKLFYLVLEGLEMEYCTATSQQKSSYTRTLGESNIEWDYTSCGWHCNFSMYHTDYYKGNDGEVIVEFTDEHPYLTYDEFKELRYDYLSLLSFLNGAPVHIRKECYGAYRRVGTPEAQIMNIYSFERKKSSRHNDYIPLNNFHNRSSNILNRVMVGNFNKFQEWNQKMDLSSIIHYLNGAAQSASLDERFFILIIAFERLTALYAELDATHHIFHPTKEDYKQIKEKLFAVLEEHRADFGEYFDRAKSVIGGLNLVQRLSTKEKMYGILSDVGIEVTEDIANLIDEVRNEVVHKGDIGQGIAGYKNTFLLNDLLHEIILRLIDYSGPKKSTVLFR
jgi:hypothetical protein